MRVSGSLGKASRHRPRRGPQQIPAPLGYTLCPPASVPTHCLGRHSHRAPPSPCGAGPASRAPAARLLSRPPPPLLWPGPLGPSALPPVRTGAGCLLSRQSGQPSPFPARGSGAEGPAGGAAMEAAARRRQHPGAAGGPGAQPGASFLQARWARVAGRS